MANFWVITPKQRRIGLIAIAAIMVGAAYWRYESMRVEQAAQAAPQETRILHMVTDEFKLTLEDGTEIEAYQFAPSSVHANEGERVELHIRGVNGHRHDFVIEGLDISGTIEKNKETIIRFTAMEGVYRIVCKTHADAASNGPMIGYIVVD
ncbi:cupredoxin domain-containing protein [Paenibacillus popilliae]|uniref:Predicted transcriptional regulator n=1 Tax=Paenibacillus popilliae ATCC 14706 TaxID=1212764 RepID=M9L915_PAEPP|nr:cupredoxin domain-containing protein [Paenibacillus popilliae]GAC41802.1 predicted transcriptional regulator [Paenibacillus popilliae ATCC 14706]